ncbi:MAG: hypothetical protein WBG37_01320 [Desulfobacterales bacterium]
MANDELREDDALQPGKGPSAEATRVGGHDASSQADEIIDLTDPVGPEALAPGEAGQTLEEALSSTREEPTVSFEDPQQAPPGDAPDAVSLPSLEEEPQPQGGVQFDDEVLEITAADLLDDEALSLAVEETVEALDLQDSELLVDDMSTEPGPLLEAVDVNDTLDEQFMQSLAAGSSGDSAPEQVATWDDWPAKGDDLDQLLAEMVGEIGPESAYPEKTIVLEDVVQGPDWSSIGGSLGETGDTLPLSAADLGDTAVTAEDLMPGESPDASIQFADSGLALEGATAAAALKGFESAGDSAQGPSQAQLEAALERVVTKMYGQKIDGLLNQVIERTVSREIVRLKERMLEDVSDN